MTDGSIYVLLILTAECLVTDMKERQHHSSGFTFSSGNGVNVFWVLYRIIVSCLGGLQPCHYLHLKHFGKVS